MNIIDFFKNALPRALSAPRVKFQTAGRGIEKRYGSTPVSSPDKNSAHKVALGAGKVKFKRPSIWGKILPFTVKFTPTNHQRVVMGRAARLGISVKEYEMRYPKG